MADWQSLQSLKEFSSNINALYAHQLSYPIVINRHLILFRYHPTDTILTYDVYTDEWSELMTHSYCFDYYSVPMALDDKKKILYIYSRQNLLKINMNTKTTEICEYSIDVGHNSSMLLIDHQLHIIGGSYSDSHYILQQKQKRMQEIHRFGDFYESGFDLHQTVYLQKKQMILMMGGYGEEFDRSTDKIYFYDINKREWNLFGLTLPIEMDSFGCIATKYEKYVITFGGEDSVADLHDDIYIFDIENIKIKQSKIVCPIEGKFHSLLIDDTVKNEILINGFIKQCWKLDEFKQIAFLCDDIINLIAMWYVEEYVYLKERDDDIHWKMKLDDILNKCNDL